MQLITRVHAGVFLVQVKDNLGVIIFEETANSKEAHSANMAQAITFFSPVEPEE